MAVVVLTVFAFVVAVAVAVVLVVIFDAGLVFFCVVLSVYLCRDPYTQVPSWTQSSFFRKTRGLRNTFEMYSGKKRMCRYLSLSTRLLNLTLTLRYLYVVSLPLLDLTFTDIYT